MHTLALTIRGLFARVDYWEASQRYMDRSRSGSQYWYVLAGLIAIAVVWVGLFVWERNRRRSLQRRTDPKSLFIELAERHNLSDAEQALLWKAAQRKYPDQPAVVFVDSAVLKEAAATRGADSRAYSVLLSQLFSQVAT